MNDIEEIKRRIDIVDLIGSYVTLKKAGKDYKSICPFHKEKTPSFFVSPEKQIFKCFGCGEGGDIFDFVVKQESLEFGDALKILADRAGVRLTPRTKIDRETPGLKSRLYAINRLSALFYQKILLDHPAGKSAREYLKGRGLIESTIKQFQIGYAPSQGPLTTWLARKGFTEKELDLAGRPDRFFRRIMFPIFDVVGNVVGFSGRTIDPKGEPKYLNTPETDIFHKGRILYGLFQAKKSIKEKDQVIIAEGQMDVVMSHQAGVTNAIATSGTSLTDDHLHFLYRYTPNLALAFDTDPAGEQAAKRAIMMALGQGFTVKLIPLSEKDPADLVKQDPALWFKAIERAKEAVLYIIERASSKYKEMSPDQKKQIAKAVLPYIAVLPDPIEQETWVKTLARRLAVSEKTIYLSLAKTKPGRTFSAPKVEPSRRTTLTPQETLVGLIFAYPQKAEPVINELGKIGFGSERLMRLVGALRSDFSRVKHDPTKVRDIIARKISPEELKLMDYLVFTVTHEFPDAEEAGSAIRQLISRLGSDRKEELKREFAARIAAAESSGKRKDVKKLMHEFQELISK